MVYNVDIDSTYVDLFLEVYFSLGILPIAVEKTLFQPPEGASAPSCPLCGCPSRRRSLIIIHEFIVSRYKILTLSGVFSIISWGVGVSNFKNAIWVT